MAIKHILYLALSLSGATAIDLNVQSTPPQGTSQVVDHAFPALAIAVHSFADYAGTTNSNTFSSNLIANIANKKGSPVHIRVGGTSGDKATYDPNQKTAIEIPPGTQPGTIPRNVTLGPTWFLGFQNINAQWTYMAHLNIPNGEDNAIAATREALKNIGNNLEAIEIGNEVNTYGISVADFISEWKDYASKIQSQVLAGTQYANERIFQAPVLLGGTGNPWTVQNVFQQGIDSATNIKSASCHHYQASDNPSLTLQKTFMNHTNIVNGLQYYSQPAAFLAQTHPLVSLHLGEDNSLLGGENRTALVGVFGNALWMADYLLYGMTRNVTQLNIQQITGVAYSSWRPITYEDQGPAVYPPYYGQVFVADVMGTNVNNGFQIHSLDLGLDEFSAYTIFQNGKVAKVVLINLQQYNANSGARPSQSVNIRFDSAMTSSTATLKQLTAPGADSRDGVTWAGEQYTYASNGKPVNVGPAPQTVNIVNHQLSVTVPASQAVLITLQ